MHHKLDMLRQIFILVTFLLAASGSLVAQRNVAQAVERDPVLEADAKHNLDVAKQYFSPLKKAYKSVLARFEETYAAYPEFSKMDEFFYLAGMSSYYLSEGKGKQKVNLKFEKEKVKFARDTLRENAVAYLSTVVEKYPESKFLADAKKTLDLLKAEPK